MSDECFKGCLVRYLYPVSRNPERIAKADKDFAARLDFIDKKFPVKIRGIHKIEKKKKIILSTFVFLVMKIRQIDQSMYQKRSLKINMLIYYLWGKKAKKDTIVLSYISIYSCMITHYYIVQENIFVVIVYKHLRQQKN